MNDKIKNERRQKRMRMFGKLVVILLMMLGAVGVIVIPLYYNESDYIKP